MHLRIRITSIFAVIAVCAILASGGCESKPKPPDFGSEEGNAVARLISEELQEYREVPKLLRERVFIKGSMPAGADLDKFTKCEYDVVGKPAASDTEATAKIRIRDVESGKLLGEVEWTFAKDTHDGKSVWKIKSAPLP